MNDKQKWLLGVGVAVLVAMVVYPPWRYVRQDTHRSGGIELGDGGWEYRHRPPVVTTAEGTAGYAPIFDQPDHPYGGGSYTFAIDVTRLCLQLLALAAVVGAGWFLLRGGCLGLDASA